MSLLDSFPHKCTIRRRTTSKGSLGGNKDGSINDQTDILCWEQQASAGEVADFAKRGMSITHKIYFTSDPGVTERNQILITERNGTAISNPVPLEVKTEALPDISAGLGVVFRVMVDELTGRFD